MLGNEQRDEDNVHDETQLMGTRSGVKEFQAAGAYMYSKCVLIYIMYTILLGYRFETNYFRNLYNKH